MDNTTHPTRERVGSDYPEQPPDRAGRSERMLDGTTNDADARLIADINAADPFDGGCAADVAAATPKPINQRDDFTEWFFDKLHQRERLGIQRGMNRAAQICIDAGHILAADAIISATDKD